MKKTLKCFMAMVVMVMAFTITGITAQAASLTQTAQTKNSVTVSWPAQSRATAYYVGIGTDYSTASANASAKSISLPATSTSYTFGNLQQGTEYYVYIKYTYKSSSGTSTYEGTAASGYIKTLPGKVTGVKQTKWWYYIQNVDVQWTDQTGVDGYEYVIKNEKKKKIKSSTTSSNGCECSVDNTMAYNIQVRAYSIINGQKVYGEWSDKAYLFTQPMIDEKKTGFSGNKIKVYWGKLRGITSYDVYVSTKEKKGYKRVKKDTKKTSLTISKIKGKKINPKKTYYIYIVGKKKVGKKTYTSGRLYSMKVKRGTRSSLQWSF